jgi:hypothetical protein
MLYTFTWMLACVLLVSISAQSEMVHQYYDDKGGKVHVLTPKLGAGDKFSEVFKSVLSKLF